MVENLFSWEEDAVSCASRRASKQAGRNDENLSISELGDEFSITLDLVPQPWPVVIPTDRFAFVSEVCVAVHVFHVIGVCVSRCWRLVRARKMSRLVTLRERDHLSRALSLSHTQGRG